MAAAPLQPEAPRSEAPQPELQATGSAIDPMAEKWERVGQLPCLLTVEIAVPGFTVADLVHLQAGRIVATFWTVGQDVPLQVNGVVIAWSEFEVVHNQLAVRLTELA